MIWRVGCIIEGVMEIAFDGRLPSSAIEAASASALASASASASASALQHFRDWGFGARSSNGGWSVRFYEIYSESKLVVFYDSST
jgi:hypothetical protein